MTKAQEEGQREGFKLARRDDRALKDRQEPGREENADHRPHQGEEEVGIFWLEGLLVSGKPKTVCKEQSEGQG